MLPLQQIWKIINEFSDMGGRLLEISGGEPLMHPNLLEIVDYARQKDLNTILYTSGNVVDNLGRVIPLSMKFAENLRQAGLQKVIFNLQGYFPGTHETITQVKGSFRNVINAIKSAKLLDFWVGVHFVPMKLNYNELKDLHRLCHELEINELGILRFVPQGRGQTYRDLLELSLAQFEKFTKELTCLTSRHNNPTIRVGRPADFRCLYNSSVLKAKCDAGISRCLITPEGKVAPCPAFKQAKKYLMGRVHDESLDDIWSKSSWEELRQFDYVKLKKPCGSCEHLHECRGGCVAQRVLARGDVYLGPDPMCFKSAIQAAIRPLSIKVPG
jgi:radical SAM protein with 4Fe4S-binding SPASM domain